MKEKKSGRPVGSEIRQNIVELLAVCKKAYGYEIYQHYLEIFPRCTAKSIYYHLKKGLDTGELVLASVVTKKGEFSWGQSVIRKYFILGPQARAIGSREVETHFREKEKHRQRHEA